MKSTLGFRGPSLLLLVTVHFLIFASGLVAAAVLRRGAHFATPFASAEELRVFLELSPAAVRVSNFFLLGSAIPFGIFAVTIVSRLRFMGIRAAGTNIAHLGGLIATFALILSGTVGWILSVPEVLASGPTIKVVSFLNFLLGGMVFSVGFGLLAAGVSVTGYFTRILPRWLVFFGMLMALTGELASISLVAYPTNFFIPITRYLGFIWMFSVAIVLTRDRRGGQAASPAGAA